MRKIIFLFAIVSIIACSQSDESSLQIENKIPADLVEVDEKDDASDSAEVEIEIDLPQTWTLFKMKGSFGNSETVGEDLEWQEIYVFNEDKTFEKKRTRDNEVTLAAGDFRVVQSNNRISYILDFYEDNEIIANCTSTNIEYLSILEEDEKILVSSWNACDGPGLYYQLGE